MKGLQEANSAKNLELEKSLEGWSTMENSFFFSLDFLYRFVPGTNRDRRCLFVGPIEGPKERVQG